MTPFLFVSVYLRYMNILVLFRVPTIAFSLPYFMKGGNYTVSCYLCEHSAKTLNEPTDFHETWCELLDPGFWYSD